MSLLRNNKVTFKQVRPNPLFENWLNNIYEEAKCKKSKFEPMLKEAVDSLSKYPMQLKSGAECILLKGFGKELCKYLDICLEKHKSNLCCGSDNDNTSRCDTPSSSSSSIPFNAYIPRNNGHSTADANQNYEAKRDEDVNIHNGLTKNIRKPKTSMEVDTISNSDTNTNSESIKSTNSDKGVKKSKKTYKPAYRSGGYAILVALLENCLENTNKPSMTKEDLIEKAQTHCEESFIRPKPESHYTAWANITRLISKGLVEKVKRKKVEYSLTETGKQLARELLKDSRNRPSVNDIIFNDEPTSSNAPLAQNDIIMVDNEVLPTAQSTYNVIDMPPGSFDIILLIDKNETGGLRKKNDPTMAEFKKYPDLKHEYRSLKVGDFTWIARSTINKDQEIVLPYVVERKRMDDLGASLKDGRYHEQKFRLRKCGLKHIIYLVEDYGKNKHVGMPIQTLMQALANTRVQDGFKVHVTKSLSNTARFLAMMTKRLTIRYKEKCLNGRSNLPIDEELMTFEYFNKFSAKTKALTVTETFIKLLLQLKGLSVDKALAITSKYPTPRSLIKAYSKCGPGEGECLLTHLKYGDLNRNVGPTTSKIVYELFSSSDHE